MYIIVLGIIISIGLNGVINTSKAYKTFCYFCMFFLLLTLLVIRDYLGVDYSAYVEIFERVPNLRQLFFGEVGFQNFEQEPGYILINSIVKIFNFEHTVMFAIISLISMSFIFLSVPKYTKYIYLSIGIYYSRFYFLRDMGQIRAGVAISIILYGLQYISGNTKKEKIKYFLFILLASSFHISTLIGIPMYFFNRFIDKNRKKVFMILIASLIFGLLPLKNILSTILSNFISTSYLFDGHYAYEAGLKNPVLIMQIIFLILFISFEKNIFIKQNYYYEIRNCYVFSICFLLAFNQFAVIAGRLSTIYATLEIFIIPSFIYVLKNKKIAYTGVILYIILMFYVNVLLRLGDSGTYFPYRSFLF